MATSLTLDEHLEALDVAGRRLIDLAEAAGLDADVPTCPAWDVRALVAHQAMVHRWAAAHVGRGDPDAVPNQTAIRTDVDDLPAYYRDGLAALLAALGDAPDDLTAMTFLNDAPPPRRFWARRQAHETTIHMVDALAAQLGRVPAADEVAVDTALAVDGLDELLRGFFTRGRSKLYDGVERTVAVVPDDADAAWLLHVDERLTVTDGDLSAADATIAATAARLYLALWNRGDEVTVSGQPAVLDRWRETQRVGW